MDEPARQQAFVTALVTEHFVQASARAATITESNGRAAIYLSAVSSGLVAFGFLAQGAARLAPFVAAVLPALFILGVFTFIRLVQTSIEAAVLTLQIQRIRDYYRTLVPEAQQFFDAPGTNDALAVAMATSGNRASPVEMLFTAAAMIAAVNSILGGAGLALLAGTLTPFGPASALAIGAVGTVILFGLHLLYGYRRAAPTAGWPPLTGRRRLPPPPQAPGNGQDNPSLPHSSLQRRWSSPPNWPWSNSDRAPTRTRERPQEVLRRRQLPKPAMGQETTMKAIVQDRYGDLDVLEFMDIDTPVVNADAVLVRVHAAAVGKGDWLTVRGLPYVARMRYGLPKPKHRVPGFDVAGRVEVVGSNVMELQAGDAVFGWCDGSFAEYASVPEGQLVLKPANLTFEQAAAVPISGFAALQALRDTGGVQPGQQVVIIGASGGVGSFAVQLAKAFGAEVTGVCSTKSLDLVRSIGADHVIDYTREDFTRTGQQRYDLILEMAGNRSLADLRRALTPKGTLVLVGGSGGRWLMGTGRTLRAVVVSPFVGQRLRSFFSKPRGADLVVLKELIESGKLTPVIDRTFPLSETSEAIRYVGERSTQGKTVITV